MPTVVPCLSEIDPLKLVRNGTEQGDRDLFALDPENVPVHDRSMADTMLYARAYASYLTFYSASNTIDGTWEDFFSNDVSVALASAAVQDVDRFRSVLASCFSDLNDLDIAGSPDVVRYRLSFIFGAVGTLAVQLDELKEYLPSDIALKATLTNLIKQRIVPALKQFIAYAKADDSLPASDRLLLSVLPPADAEHETFVMGRPVTVFHDMILRGLSADWFEPSSDWVTFVDDIPADPSVFGDSTATVFERAHACSSHALFSSAYDRFLKVYARVVREAGIDLTMTLTSYDRHDPHYALFLSFLHAFEHARHAINTLTQRHLDLYYRTMLQLKERPAEPSAAHVLIKLARSVATCEIPAATTFSAGKDATKQPIVFSNPESLVANPTIVAQVARAVRDEEAYFVEDNVDIAKPWHPFRTDRQRDHLGFAIASHYLHLAEGERTISITFGMSGYAGPVAEDLAEHFTCRLTSADGWLDVTPDVVMVDASSSLNISLILSGDAPSVVGFTSKVHDGPYTTTLPVIEVRLTSSSRHREILDAFNAVISTSCELAVSVDRVRALIVANDLGSVDPSKPFAAFGAIPSVGSNLILGSPEVFTKRGLTSCTLHLSWRDRPSSFTVGGSSVLPTATLQRLLEGVWDAGLSNRPILRSDTETFDLTAVPGAFNPLDDASRTFDETYGITTTSGFLRLVLRSSLGHSGFALALADHVIKRVKNETTTAPAVPYTPTLDSVTISYSAATTNVERFHIDTFGAVAANDHVFPQRSFAGECFIGLKGASVPQNISLLFQVVDGSADPLTLKPHPHLVWSYLKDDRWVDFASADVDDRTQELLSSGVIEITLPEDATPSATAMPNGYHWIRAAVVSHIDAVCELVGIHASAVKTTFTDRGNDPSFLSTPLAPGSIAKLVTPQRSVKAVEQPYASFGGKLSEQPDQYYTRVSERLRHKDRAITLWDIERLVLEAFPSIHRVKCLNHTRYEPTETGSGIYHELAAGHVTVIAIPKVYHTGTADPLRPYTSLTMLNEIADHLSKRMNCFTTLHVRNPAYEQLRVHCNVRLHDGYDPTYSLNLLRTTITQFLAPWAYDLNTRPSFGGKVYQSALINVIEEQPYVDHVTDFRLFHDVDDVLGTSSVQVAQGTRAVSILASAPADQHVLTLLDDAAVNVTHESCGCES